MIAKTMSTSSQQPYASLSLSGSKSIRLLELDKPSKTNAGNDSHPLTGALRVVSLQDFPTFTALSYVWGDYSIPDDTILCNNVALRITTNCRDALLQLRKRDEPVVIWVDAICINQSDDAEKSNQISLMQDIYTWANTVYIWLGTGTTESDRAMDCLSMGWRFRAYLFGSTWASSVSGSELNRHERRKLWKQYHFFGPILLRDFLSSFVTCRLSDRRYNPNWSMKARFWMRYRPHCIEDILRREWIQRAWTFQELILASDPIFLCGDKELHWGSFLGAVEAIRHYKKYHFPQHKSYKPPRNIDAWYNLSIVWMNARRPSHRNGLAQRISAGEEFSFRDNEIKWESAIFPPRWYFRATIFVTGCLTFVGAIVVAICGPIIGGAVRAVGLAGLGVAILCVISTMIYVSLPCLKKIRTSDILKSLDGDTILNAVIDAVRSRKSNDPKDKAYAVYGVLQSLGATLSMADYTQSSGKVFQTFFTDLLRWRPEFLSLIVDAQMPPMDGTPSWVPDWSVAAERSWFNLQEAQTADKKAKSAAPKAVINDDELAVRGIWLATITFCTKNPTLSIMDSSGELKDESKDFILELVAWITEIRRMASVEHLQDASIPQVVFNVLEGSKTASNSILALNFDQWYQVVSRYYVTVAEAVEQKCESLFEEIWANERAREYHQYCMLRIIGKRNLFITSAGHVGTGPLATMVGDKTALISGVAVPLILRKEDQAQRSVLIGPSYIFGIMNDGIQDKCEDIIIV